MKGATVTSIVFLLQLLASSLTWPILVELQPSSGMSGYGLSPPFTILGSVSITTLGCVQ